VLVGGAGARGVAEVFEQQPQVVGRRRSLVGVGGLDGLLVGGAGTGEVTKLFEKYAQVEGRDGGLRRRRRSR